ncbi:acyl-CoA dehydrogenase family protein [Micromonospora taraxaci]|uniref:acyl-CoA dehydrogenase family protein n=1 Tax=Micromonospora taraxaci TaxID=1316803 RepID=UPI0033A59853
MAGTPFFRLAGAAYRPPGGRLAVRPRTVAGQPEVQAMAGQSHRLLVAGARPGGWAAASKHLATAVLAEVADEALQLSGGDGYRRGHPADRAVRDATGLALAGGTTETHVPTD